MIDPMSILILVFSLTIILISCAVFTNGIEWLGHRLGLAESATGSILAAVGTAMPETIIPLIAIFLGSDSEGKEIGEGAILGAPFMLSTLAMFVGGLAVLYAFRKGRRGPTLVLCKGHAERDLKYFMIAYSLTLIASILGMSYFSGLPLDHSYVNYILAVALLAAYVLYIHKTLKDEREDTGNRCPPLHVGRIFGVDPEDGRFGMTMILLQVSASLLGIIIGAKFFVGGVEEVSKGLGVSSIFIAFVIAPIATELPEKFNSVIWYLRSKDTLALGNITGAMVFQSSIPVGIGLMFTPWELEPINVASIAMALVAAFWTYYELSHRGISYRIMLASGSFYLLYLILLLAFIL